MSKKPIWFISHPSGGRDHAPEFFSALEYMAVENPGIQLNWPPDIAENAEGRRKEIEEADLVIAEVSSASTGTGIDLGWANILGKPIIAFHQGATPISPAVPPIAKSIHIYISDEDIVTVLKALA